MKHFGGSLEPSALSVFPANRGVPRPLFYLFSTTGNWLSVFPANRGVPRRSRDAAARKALGTFSIPCESWGSATGVPPGDGHEHERFQYSLRIVGFRDSGNGRDGDGRGASFQYSLRIVGFRDRGVTRGSRSTWTSFSIPCESWGSATELEAIGSDIVVKLSVFPANRGVPRPTTFVCHLIIPTTFSIPCESWGSATALLGKVSIEHTTNPFSIPCESWGSATLGPNFGLSVDSRTFSIPCESWGSATDWAV